MVEGGAAGEASAGVSAPGPEVVAGGELAGGAPAVGVSAPGPGVVAGGNVAGRASAAGVSALGAGAGRLVAGGPGVSVTDGEGICARAARKTTTMVAVKTPAMTPIGRTPMSAQVDVAALPGRAGRPRLPELSASCDLYGGAVRHQFSVIGGLIEFG